jgi:hypothetical protein
MTQSQELARLARIDECKRIVAGAAWYTEVEQRVAKRMLETIYKEQ